MTKFKFWNEVCKYGAIIGLVMSVAFVIEQSLMLSGWFSTMGLVWVLAAVVYIVLLYRFAKRRREQYGQEQGFPFGHGLGFILALILASAMIKGVVEYLYRSVFIGYSSPFMLVRPSLVSLTYCPTMVSMGSSLTLSMVDSLIIACGV